MEYIRGTRSVEEGDISRKEEKVVRIGNEAEWRQESREEMTGERAA